MKALHFAKPLEYRLETPAEELRQGETFSGTLSVANRDTQAHNGLALEVGLAYAEFKTLKAEGAAALERTERQTVAEGIDLAPGASRQAQWTFTLPSDCPITSKSGGLFLLYGAGLDAPQGWGRLDLRVRPAQPLETLIATAENLFSFEERARKHTEGYMEVKLRPPGSYATLEEVLLRMRIREARLDLEFRCRVKGLGRGAGGGVKSRWVTFERSYSAEEYLIGASQPNRALFKRVLDEVLHEATPDMLRKE